MFTPRWPSQITSADMHVHNFSEKLWICRRCKSIIVGGNLCPQCDKQPSWFNTFKNISESEAIKSVLSLLKNQCGTTVPGSISHHFDIGNRDFMLPSVYGGVNFLQNGNVTPSNNQHTTAPLENLHLVRMHYDTTPWLCAECQYYNCRAYRDEDLASVLWFDDVCAVCEAPKAMEQGKEQIAWEAHLENLFRWVEERHLSDTSSHSSNGNYKTWICRHCYYFHAAGEANCRHCNRPYKGDSDCEKCQRDIFLDYLDAIRVHFGEMIKLGAEAKKMHEAYQSQRAQQEKEVAEFNKELSDLSDQEITKDYKSLPQERGVCTLCALEEDNTEKAVFRCPVNSSACKGLLCETHLAGCIRASQEQKLCDYGAYLPYHVYNDELRCPICCASPLDIFSQTLKP